MFLKEFENLCTEERAWDVWKHKINGKSFAEFYSQIKKDEKPEANARRNQQGRCEKYCLSELRHLIGV